MSEGVQKLDPIRESRIQLVFPEQWGIPSWAVKSFEMPMFTKVMGMTWTPENILVNLIDTVQVDVSKRIHEVMFGDFDPCDTHIEVLSKDGSIVKTFVLKNCDLSEVSYGYVDYKSENELTIQVKLKYKICEIV